VNKKGKKEFEKVKRKWGNQEIFGKTVLIMQTAKKNFLNFLTWVSLQKERASKYTNDFDLSFPFAYMRKVPKETLSWFMGRKCRENTSYKNMSIRFRLSESLIKWRGSCEKFLCEKVKIFRHRIFYVNY
jgi:hypothetical protein